MNPVLALIAALAGDATTKDATAANTPALDDNTKKISTTEFLRNQFAGSGKQSLAGAGYQRLPGGLTLHWGSNDAPSGGSLTVVTVPNVVTGLLFVVGGIGTPTGTNNHNIGCSLRAGFPTHILLQNTDSINHGVNWLALSN